MKKMRANTYISHPLRYHFLFKLAAAAFCLLMLASRYTYAATPAWQIVPNESEITFTAVQNGSPLTGKFTSFTGEINADPNQLTASHVRIVVDIASVSASYGEVADTLKTPDWFDVKAFPKAVFEASQFTKTGNNTYQANGTLTIRNKTLPIVLQFTQEEHAEKKAKVKGSTSLKRTAFGVGRGEWAKTDAVEDNVQINFVLTATKKD